MRSTPGVGGEAGDVPCVRLALFARHDIQERVVLARERRARRVLGRRARPDGVAPGSACSIAIGTGLSPMAPGSVQGLQVVVDDVEATRTELLARGVEASEVQHFPWGSFTFFSDPDGNGWSVQQIAHRG